MSETQPSKEKKGQAKPAGEQKVVKIVETIQVKALPGTEVRRDLAKAIKKDQKGSS